MIHLKAPVPLFSLINMSNHEGLSHAIAAHHTEDLWLGVFQSAEQNHPHCLSVLLDELVQRNAAVHGSWTLALDMAAVRGNISCLERLLEFNTPKNSNTAVWNAASGGHLECVRALLPYFDPVADNNHALEGAVRHGNPDGVRLLLTVCDPSLNNWEVARVAVAANNIETLKALVPCVHPQAEDTKEVLNYAMDRDPELLAVCVQIYDAHSNPMALAEAVHFGKEKCVDILFPISNVPKAIDLLRKNTSPQTDTLEIRWQRHILTTHVESSDVVRARKM